MQQIQSKTLQLVKCIGRDVNFHVNKCRYGYKIIQFQNKVNRTKTKKHITTSKVYSLGC